MKQKDIFLAGEGNAWFNRNSVSLAKQSLPESDPLLLELIGLRSNLVDVHECARVLEVGCGAGRRLAWLQKNLNMECIGIDPSDIAVSEAKSAGVQAQVGTADLLPYADKSFDILIFGFCLYLCDREDLFKIAAEADRVLRNKSYLLIKDFFSPIPLAREYQHKTGLFSYKMDYKTLFTWNPDYSVYSNRIAHHIDGGYTDKREEWVATSVLRKYRSS